MLLRSLPGSGKRDAKIGGYEAGFAAGCKLAARWDSKVILYLLAVFGP